jgi:hypothetical protein
MGTVYVFGAGASFDFGYPLCSNLGEKLLKFMSDSTNPWIQATACQYLMRKRDNCFLKAYAQRHRLRSFLEATLEE